MGGGSNGPSRSPDILITVIFGAFLYSELFDFDGRGVLGGRGGGLKGTNITTHNKSIPNAFRNYEKTPESSCGILMNFRASNDSIHSNFHDYFLIPGKGSRGLGREPKKIRFFYSPRRGEGEAAPGGGG